MILKKPQEFLMIFSPRGAILGSPLINDVFFFLALSIAARPVFKMVLKAGGKKAGQRGREHVENKQGHIGTFPLS